MQDYSTELHSIQLHLVELCSEELRSKPNFHSRNNLFWLKKWLKKGITGIKVESLA